MLRSARDTLLSHRPDVIVRAGGRSSTRRTARDARL